MIAIQVKGQVLVLTLTSDFIPCKKAAGVMADKARGGASSPLAFFAFLA